MCGAGHGFAWSEAGMGSKQRFVEGLNMRKRFNPILAGEKEVFQYRYDMVMAAAVKMIMRNFKYQRI